MFILFISALVYVNNR